MKHNYKVSVIVPVYNVEKYIEECVCSILNQSYNNIELILVNDGSKDNSGIILDRLQKNDHRIKVVHKENGGVSSARNIGLENVTGDYVCFVDGDDWVSSDYVEYLLSTAIRYDAPISLTTELFTNYMKKQIKSEKIYCLSAEETVEKILCYHIPIGCYCKLFKTSLLKENKLCFDKNIRMGEGFNFNIEAFMCADKVSVGNKRIYYYRQDNSDSATTKFSLDKCENGLFAIDEINRKVSYKSNKIKNALSYAEWRTTTDMYDMLALSGKADMYPEFYKKCRRKMKENSLIALKVPVSIKNKIRAIIMSLNPDFVIALMRIRGKLYRV